MKLIPILFMLTYSCLTWAKSGEFHSGVSFVHMQMHYKEPGVMDEKGKLQGLGVDARYDFTDPLRVAFQARFLSGELEYDGATFSGVPISQTTKDKIREYRLLLQYVDNNFSFTSGYGYRYWENDLVISYLRETTYHYVPIGIRYTIAPFYISYEHRYFLNGVNKSHMSDVNPSRSDVTLKQESGSGYALEVGFFTRIASFDFKVSLAYEYWQIDDSKTGSDGVDTLVEPHNRTNSLVLSAGIFF